MRKTKDSIILERNEVIIVLLIIIIAIQFISEITRPIEIRIIELNSMEKDVYNCMMNCVWNNTYGGYFYE